MVRTGGDDFTILMPNTVDDEAHGIVQSIQRECGEYNASIKDVGREVNLSYVMQKKRIPEAA
jgi:GGDEF domain-containing protein